MTFEICILPGALHWLFWIPNLWCCDRKL